MTTAIRGKITVWTFLPGREVVHIDAQDTGLVVHGQTAHGYANEYFHGPEHFIDLAFKFCDAGKLEVYKCMYIANGLFHDSDKNLLIMPQISLPLEALHGQGGVYPSFKENVVEEFFWFAGTPAGKPKKVQFFGIVDSMVVFRCQVGSKQCEPHGTALRLRDDKYLLVQFHWANQIENAVVSLFQRIEGLDVVAYEPVVDGHTFNQLKNDVNIVDVLQDHKRRRISSEHPVQADLEAFNWWTMGSFPTVLVLHKTSGL